MQIFNYDIYCKIYKSIVIYKNFEMCNFKYNKRFEHFNEIVWKVKVFQTYLLYPTGYPSFCWLMHQVF